MAKYGVHVDTPSIDAAADDGKDTRTELRVGLESDWSVM